MKKLKHIYSVILVMTVFMLGTVAHAEENPAFGNLNVTYKDWMQQIYAACAANNYAVAQTYDGSPTARALIEEMEAAGLQSYYCIFDGTTDTGKGVGVYIVPNDGGYYFYYGDYVNGLRQGNGVSFYDYSFEDPTGIHYYSYTGQWANDKPNGTGTRRSSYEDQLGHFIITVTGNYTDGLENGVMTQAYFDGIEVGYFIWTSELGTPKFTTVTYADINRANAEMYGPDCVYYDVPPIQVQVYDLQGNPIIETVSSYTESPDDICIEGIPYSEYIKSFEEDGQEIYALQSIYHYYDEDDHVVYPIDYEGYYSWWYHTKGTKMGIFGFTE